MAPVPMPPIQNLLVIAASFCVAGALYPWYSGARLMCAGAAIAIVVGLCVARLRAHAAAAGTSETSQTQRQIERIRAERARRMGPRR